MPSDSHKQLLMEYGPSVGRILMGFLFFFSGVGMMLGGPAGSAGYFESLGIPMAGLVVYLVIAVKVIAGGALMAGYKTAKASMALILFTLGASLFAHMNIEDINLFKNLAIIGGLLYVIAYGPGDHWKFGGKIPPQQL